MNCEEDLLNYFKDVKLNYHFDDTQTYGKTQPITSTPEYNYIYSSHMKEFKYGDMIDDNMLNKISKGLPAEFTLQAFIGIIYDQKNIDISVSCCIAASISIRTNYINHQRYRITRWIFGNKLPIINPSILYINWNANIQNMQRYKEFGNLSDMTNHANISPSIYSHLISLESHKIVDISKYNDDFDKLNTEPNLMSFYHANKSKDFTWYKIKQDLNMLKILLMDGYPIICAIVLYKDALGLISYQFGIISTPLVDNEIPVGSNPIVIIGYNESKKCFYFLNSWSDKWGDHGIGEIKYEYIIDKRLAGDFAMIDYKN